jgi:hypothetical protein
VTVARFTTFAASLALVSCGARPQSIASTFPPGTPIVSFPNSVDRTWTSTIQSNPYGQVSGVDGRTIMVSAIEQGSSDDLAALDMAGNLGIRGALSSASSRKMKKDIVPYRDDPLAVIRSVNFVRFRYKAEPESSHPHVGFIAEDTPSDLSGVGHDSFMINNSLAVNMAATQALDREVRELREEVRELKAQQKRMDAIAESRSSHSAE